MLRTYDKALLDAALDALGMNSAYTCATRYDYDSMIGDAWRACDQQPEDREAITLAGQLVRDVFTRATF